ncbi:hypothetical protein EMPS_00608 [Entomortierella parvispora]|uniref:Protein kinase domain-containing protein n=1 Tax=Entomortierella parvispora TaxID=205924 RepID=A0A9P3H1E6_9FUNG|nr:hypothetical protein EMPS_00608 [Entomortierella parvispora]
MPPVAPPRGSQLAIIQAINDRRRAERSQMMMSKGSAGNTQPSPAAGWVNGRPTFGSKGPLTISPSFAGATTTAIATSSPPSTGTPSGKAISPGLVHPHTSEQLPTPHRSGDITGLKIRIPRDLPNLPDAFRRRGAIRSQPTSLPLSASPSSILTPYPPVKATALPYASPGTIKRTYSTMLLEDHQLDLGNHPLRDSAQDNDKRQKVASIPSSLMPLPPQLANAKNLAIRTARLPPNATPRSNPLSNLISSHSSSKVHSSVQRHRSNSSSKSASPNGTPVRIASPSIAPDTTVVVPPLQQLSATEQKATPLATASHSHGTRSNEGAVQTTSSPADADEVMSSAVSASTVATDQDLQGLKPIELVRVGMNILDSLVCNTFCKGFINPVPSSVSNYYVVIKKPMDLTTIERKLWKSLELAGGSGSGHSIADDGLEGYTCLEDLEKDLRRIFQNATYFNSPSHPIYKEAHSYQNQYLGLLASYRQGQMQLNAPIPHESFRPEMISLSEPGPLYLFRAHTLREMERKMTDISTDLFSTLHQPLFDASFEFDEISPEKPRFVRMYINKNRSVLAKCRDEQFARVAILTDLQIGKSYTASTQSESSPGAPKSGKDNGAASISMVNVSCRVLIGKPIGERHDMVTVGDLDCPNAWVTVACVKAMELDVEVPTKFEKGTLSKMRHELVPYALDTKISPEHQRAFADALGLLLPTSTRAGQVHGFIGQRSAIPMPPPAAPVASTPKPSSPKGLGISTPSSMPSAEPSPASVKSDSSEAKDAKDTKQPLLTVHDQGTKGRLLVTIRSSSRKAKNALTHVYAASTPATPLLSGMAHTLSSQVPSTPSEGESLSAPDRLLLNEQITKRGNKMLGDLKVVARQKGVPYTLWDDIEPTLTVDSAHGLFKRIFHVKGDEGVVVQNFKEMDAESFEQRVREVACLLELKGLEGVGQIQSVIDNDEKHLVGLSMTKYSYTLKQYATNARKHPTPCQKLSLIQDMVSAMCDIHEAGLAHRDLSEVNIMVDEDPKERLDDNSPRPHVKVIDFGKSVFVRRREVERWSMQEKVSDEELALLPLVVLPPDHGYKLYRSILTLPKTKQDHTPLPPVDPRSEDVYSLGVLIWRTFSGKSPWNGAIEDDLKTIRYLVASDSQIRFQLEREVTGPMSRALLLRCLTAQAETRSTAKQLKEWLAQPQISSELLKEFEALGGGRKKVRKNLD